MGFEPGGLAEKLGNRYEGWWVAKQLLRLLNEEIRCVTVEAIGDDERGVDLWIERTDGIWQAQQCKARNGSKESWSIGDLKSRGILNYLRTQLDRDPTNEYALVSGVGATTFADICNSARLSNDNPADFLKHQIQSVGKEREKVFNDFCEALDMDATTPSDLGKSVDYLKRTHIFPFHDNQNTQQELLAWTGFLLGGDPRATLSVLRTYMELQEKFRKPVYADELREHLSAHDIFPKRLEHDKRVAPAIFELQKQFRDSIRPFLIGGKLIPREEMTYLIETIEQNTDVIVHGAQGNGKSTILHALTQVLNEQEIPYLPIRLDRREPKDNAAQFGHDLGLPDSPAYSLAGLAGKRTCVLILDQLDAIRWTCSHSPNALDVCKELLRHVRALRQNGRKISVVLCCRTFDLENDPEIRNWLTTPAENGFVKFEVNEFTAKTVQQVVGASFHRLTERQKRVLSCAQNLSIFMELSQRGAVPEFRTATELMSRYWVDFRRKIENTRVGLSEVDAVLNSLVDYLESHGSISAPKRILNTWITTKEAMISRGIILENANRITFRHQSFLGYLIADRLMQQMRRQDDDPHAVIAWLGPRDKQSLFRREQLRHVLTMLQEEAPTLFDHSVMELIESDDVRFHLKHLVLELIGQLEDVSKELGDYCISLLSRNCWKQHVLETIFLGHPTYIKLLLERELINGWLNSEVQDDVDRAFWLLRSVAEKIPDSVTELLEPFLLRDHNWKSWILSTICLDPMHDSERMFRLRIELARRGYVEEFVNWKHLCSEYPIRAFQLIEAVLSTWDPATDEDQPNSSESQARKAHIRAWIEKDGRALEAAVQDRPCEAWDLFAPQIVRLTSHQFEPYDPAFKRWLKNPASASRIQGFDIARGVVELAIVAGQKLAAEHPEELLKRTKPLEKSISPIVKEILIDAYTHLPIALADEGVKYLLGDPERFRAGADSREPEWKPAMRLVEALSPYCSMDLFKRLESEILHYHSPDEREMARRCWEARRKGYLRHYWGHAQYFLLPALCLERISQYAIDLIRVLKRKFVGYSEEDFLKRAHGSGGSIGSKLDPSLDRISDLAWLGIIGNMKIQLDSSVGKWEPARKGGSGYLATSIRQFSSSLKKISRRFPERFGQLALRFPDDVHPIYVSAILDGIALKEPDSGVPEGEKEPWRPASIGTIEAILERYQTDDDLEIAISFCRLVSERNDENWSDKAVEKLISYSFRHPLLEETEPNAQSVPNSDEDTAEALYGKAINSLQGQAARSIGQLLGEHPDWLQKLRPGIEALAADPHPAVKISAIDALLPVLNIDKDQAVRWFCRICSTDLRVPASPRAVYFFNWSISSHYDQVGPIIKKMVRSSSGEIVQKGAEGITAYWLIYGMFAEEIAECTKGSMSQRKGVARVASSFVKDTLYSERCQKLLFPLLNDPEKEVRSEVSNIFYGGDRLDASSQREFLAAYAGSSAFADDSSGFVHFLMDFKESLLPFSQAIFAMFRSFSTTLREKSRDITSRIAYDISEASSLLLRLYEQSEAEQDRDLAVRCLDLWDLLFQNRVGIVKDLSREIEK